jgi:hypothetical protein
MLSASAHQGLVAVVLRFISRAIRTFHSAVLGFTPLRTPAVMRDVAEDCILEGRAVCAGLGAGNNLLYHARAF